VTRAVISLALAFATAGGLLAGCVDPGCVRNSECEVNFSCLGMRCVLTPGDGGTLPALDDDAGVE
jgi:hypothetical protein